MSQEPRTHNENHKVYTVLYALRFETGEERRRRREERNILRNNKAFLIDKKDLKS